MHLNNVRAVAATITIGPTPTAFVVKSRRRSASIIPSPSQARFMTTTSIRSSMIPNPWNFFKRENNNVKTNKNDEKGDENNEWGEQLIQSYIASINSREEPNTIVQRYFHYNVTFIDTSFYNPIIGKEALTKHLYLHAGSSALSTFPTCTTKRESTRDVSIVIDDIVLSSESSSSDSSFFPFSEKEIGNSEAKEADVRTSKVCVLYHLEATTTTTTSSAATEETTINSDGSEETYTIPDTCAITFYHLQNGKIVRVFDVTEPPSPKPEDGGLRLLKAAANVMKLSTTLDNGISGDGTGEEDEDQMKKNDAPRSIIEQYFTAWNRRNIADASLLFATDCIMKDMQYDTAFFGREDLTKHLLRVKDCLPSSFNFVVDDIVSTSNKAGALWHVENNGSPLAFTRGCSFYTFDEQKGDGISTKVIQTGFEIPEKAPPKMGYIRTLVGKFENEPIRVLPAILWVAYMYILFFSDGILPGANVLALEQRTWEEVRDLSLNFFLVAPMLKLSFSPVCHPMLEGVFNFLLSWAAMFAGFLSDERKNKPNLLPFGFMLVGMQFLTSGFLLPYLFTRTSESNSMEETMVYQEDIDGALQQKVAEWRPLGSFLGGVGALSIVWALFARYDDFGGFDERYKSFIDLLSIDRVGSSFIVDLVIFALFQSWFVDDDMIRRGIAGTQVKEENGISVGGGGGEWEILRNVAKYIPFFGLVVYLSLRPPLPSRSEEKEPQSTY
ncbi:hypothetical protein ACHAXH_009855 [Discostella pseudostelligera]